jgi:hypothetical protein
MGIPAVLLVPYVITHYGFFVHEYRTLPQSHNTIHEGLVSICIVIFAFRRPTFTFIIIALLLVKLVDHARANYPSLLQVL